ncbi:MAG: substrate-binding domain-containing protein [Anaerolineae bacterium]|nr:substrate-binding domain-containing protein [Anaerolineae bacterium]
MLVKPHQQVFIDEFVPNIITGLVQVTQERGFRILVEIVGEKNRRDEYIELAMGKEIAGMIILLHYYDAGDIENVVRLVADGFPVVSTRYVDSSVCSVSEDHLGGVQEAVTHLIRLGHRRIACISFAPPAVATTSRERLEKYRAVLEASGIPYDEGLVRYGVFDPETGYEAMQSLLKQEPPPTALFAMNDIMAFGAMAAIHEQGLRIPDDIAVVSYNDWRLARYTNPPLTTVRAPDIEQGSAPARCSSTLSTGRFQN